MTASGTPPLQVHESLEDVAPQGSYLAKRCPFRVVLDAAPPPGVERLQPSPADQRRMDEGIAFERVVGDRLVALHGDDVADLRPLGEDWDAHRDATMAAMRDGAPIILDARLEQDVNGRRSGLPDVLVRGAVRADGRWGYLPVDVKHHGTVAAKRRDGFGPLIATGLDHIGRHPHDIVASEDEFARRKDNNKDDLHQLAHYWRMLQAHDVADDRAGAWGAVIGSDQRCTWYRLDHDDVTFQSWTKVTGRWSALERYDREFGFRLDVLARVADGRDPGVAPALISRWCESCHWREHCTARMLDDDEVTLLRRPLVSWERRGKLHAVGLDTRTAIARLDLDAAQLADVPRADALIAAAADAPADARLVDLATRKDQRKKLADTDLVTAEDVVRLDADTVEVVRRLGDMSGLRGMVVQARADVTGAVARADGVERVHVQRADVQIDLDIESFEDDVYLWGVRINDPNGIVAPAGTSYLDHFVDLSFGFDPVEIFATYWRWYADLAADLEARGFTHAVYSWSHAERTHLRRNANSTGDPNVISAVSALLADSDRWVDLEMVVKDQLVLPARGRSSIKVVGPRFAGFTGWDEVRERHDLDVVDGDESREMFARAAGVDGPPDAGSATILHDYNHADLDAMAAVRSWLSSLDDVPSIRDLRPD